MIFDGAGLNDDLFKVSSAFPVPVLMDDDTHQHNGGSVSRSCAVRGASLCPTKLHMKVFIEFLISKAPILNQVFCADAKVECGSRPA